MVTPGHSHDSGTDMTDTGAGNCMHGVDEECTWQKEAIRLLQKVAFFKGSHRRGVDPSIWFRAPVDPTVTPGYTTKVNQPMDFSTIQGKLQSNQYRAIEELNKDMLLVKNNCFVYNRPEDQVWRDCEQVFSFYDREYGKLLKRLEKVTTQKKVWNIGSFMQAQKLAKEDISFRIVQDQISKLEKCIVEKEDQIHELNADIAWREKIKSSVEKPSTKDIAVQVHVPKAATATIGIPTRVNPANTDSTNINRDTARRRVGNTVEAVKGIHGEDHQSVVDGMWLTTVKTLSRKELGKYIVHSKKCKTLKLGRISKGKDRLSKENLVRSVKTMYKGGLLSSRKYCEEMKATSDTCDPKLLPYKRLVKELKSIQARVEVHECSGDVDARYRDFENALLAIAGVYLKIDEQLVSTTGIGLHWFNRGRGHFSVALGADGAPSGKFGTSTSLLFSFLNVVDKVASCDHNFLLFGGAVKEDDEILMSYLRDLVPKMQSIEQKQYRIGDTEVKFSIDLIPGDNKWLASVAGELSNAATYPSTFADVHKDELGKMDGSVGPEGYWKPWLYERRLGVAEKVGQLKADQVKAKKVNRQKILKEIAGMKSRQEFKPVLGKYVDKCMVDPLHIKNNMCQQMNVLIVSEAINRTDERVLSKGFQDPGFCCSPIGKYLDALKNVLKAGKLYIQLKRWFNENKASQFNTSCRIRFTGEDSLKFCRGFSYLIESCEVGEEVPSIRLLVLHQMCLAGRGAIALMSQIKTSVFDLQCLQEYCETYHRIHNLFLSKVTLTTWHVGYIVPYHARCVYEKYGTGLGLNTLQGREAKHKQIANYGRYSNPGNKWECIFRHEFVQLVWLPENNIPGEAKQINRSRYKKSKLHVFLQGSFPESCHCRPKSDDKECEETTCKYCSHPLKKKLLDSCKECRVSPEFVHEV